MDLLDWIREKYPKKVKDPAAWLAVAIRNNYAFPAGYVPKAERERREAAERQKQQADAESTRRKRQAEDQEKNSQALIDAYWKELTAEEQARLDAKVLELADPETRETYKNQHPKFKRMYFDHMRREHIRRTLNLPPAPDA
jgi:hypothetical protein